MVHDGSNGDVTTLAEATTQANNLIAIAEGKKRLCCNHFTKKRRLCQQCNIKCINIITFAETLSSSSYAVLDSAWCYQYDKYTDNYCYVPACSHTAGLMARTDIR